MLLEFLPSKPVFPGNFSLSGAYQKKTEENSVCKNMFLKIYLPSAKKSKLPSHQVFGVFALKVKKILQATCSKLRRDMGMRASTIYVQQQQ